MRKAKRTHVTLLGRPMTESEKINGISKSFPDVRILNYGDDFRTSRGLRDKGIVVCSECGHLCSDSQEKCPQCNSKIIAIVSDVALTEVESKEINRRTYVKSIINYKKLLR